MDQDELTVEGLLILLATALCIDPSRMNKDTSANDLNEWDSLGTINIITTLEEGIGIKFDILDIPLLISVDSIIELLKTKGYSLRSEDQ